MFSIQNNFQNTDKYVAIYIRVSTEEQAVSGNSLTEQEEELVKQTMSAGYTNYILYVDDGYSAKNLDRPQMKKLLHDIEHNKVIGLFTTRIDRLTRKVSDFGKIIDVLTQHGAFYRAVRQNFSIDTAIGRLMANILSTIAEFEREMIAERVYENLANKAKRGQLPFKPCYGYKTEKGKLVIDEKEAKWVRKMVDFYLQGKGGRYIANYLTQNGVKTKKGKIWTATTVRVLLHTPTLVGDYIWNQRKYVGSSRVKRDKNDWIIIENNHEPIITREQHNKIMKMSEVKDSVQNRVKMKTRQGNRVLSGIAVCGFCQSPMYASWQIYPISGGKVKKKTYRCSTYALTGGCVINRVDAEELDQFVINEVTKFEKTDFIEENLKFVRVPRQNDELRFIKRRIRGYDERIQRLFEALSMGVISITEFSDQKNKIETQKQLDQDELNKLENNGNSIQNLNQNLNQTTSDYGNQLLSDNMESQRLFLSMILHEIRVYRKDWRDEPEIEIVYRI